MADWGGGTPGAPGWGVAMATQWIIVAELDPSSHLITSRLGLTYHPILPHLPEGWHVPGANGGSFRTSPDGVWLV